MSADVGVLPVSVIIPLYNKGPFIEATLRSVLSSPTSPAEILVIDDGSTDDGPEKIGLFMDSRVRLLRQENAGVSAARNRGLAEARGELVAFLDADDIWHPEYLASIVAQARMFPECGIVSTHNYRFTETEEVVLPVYPRGAFDGPKVIDNFFDFWSRNVEPFYIASCAFRRTWVREAGLRFPEGESLGEDLDFIFLAAERWPVSFDGRPLVGYRRDVPGQLSRIPPGGLPPYLVRLQTRLDRGEVESRHRRGMGRILCVSRLNHIYDLVEADHRRSATRLLMDWRLLRAPRYWSRLAASLLLPRPLQSLVLPRSV